MLDRNGLNMSRDANKIWNGLLFLPAVVYIGIYFSYMFTVGFITSMLTGCFSCQRFGLGKHLGLLNSYQLNRQK